MHTLTYTSMHTHMHTHTRKLGLPLILVPIVVVSTLPFFLLRRHWVQFSGTPGKFSTTELHPHTRFHC